jgi:hypothetical protein
MVGNPDSSGAGLTIGEKKKTTKKGKAFADTKIYLSRRALSRNVIRQIGLLDAFPTTPGGWYCM